MLFRLYDVSNVLVLSSATSFIFFAMARESLFIFVVVMVCECRGLCMVCK